MTAGAAALTAAALIGVFALTACSAATGATASPDEVQEWMTAQEDPAGDELASMTGLADTTSDIADETVDGLGDQIRVDFHEPVRVADVQFTCFGAETMDFSLFTQAGSSHVGTGATDVRCADGAISVETGVGAELVDRVSVIGANSSGVGAWAAVVR